MMTMMIKRAVIVFVVAATVPDPPSPFVAGFSNLSILPPSPCSVAAKGSRRDGGNFGDSHSSHCHQRQPGGRRRRQDWSSGRASLHGLSVAISTPPSDAGDSKENTTTTTGGGGQPDYIWEVYVSEPSNKKKEKGSAAMSASDLVQVFNSLAPSPDLMAVFRAEFGSQNKGKGRGCSVRCLRRRRNGGIWKDGGGNIISALEVGNVDSVDKVYRVITKHLGLRGVDETALECMRCYVGGNQRLGEGEPSSAIELYNRAVSAAEARRPSSSRLPKGAILMKRSRAYLMRASDHRRTLRTLVSDLADDVLPASTMKVLYQTASSHPSLSAEIFARLAADSKAQQAKFRQIRYRHDMYEFASLHAVQDGLHSTSILPDDANAWMLAGECLAELRKWKESNQYYQRALEIDPSVDVQGVIEKNDASHEFMDMARASGFSGDTLRLALDVAS